MKKQLFILVFFLPHVIRAQSVIWVSNNPNDLGLVHYANLQNAIDVAQPGDTLLVYPSALSYGSVTLNKPLAIIGAGFEMDTLLQPALEISTIKSNTTVALTVNSGGSGSYISGTTGSIQLIACSNVKIYRTYGAVRIENCNQIELISNFFAGGFAGPICLCCASVRYKPYSLLVIESSNIIISNSVFNDSVIQSGTCDSDRGSIYTDGNSTFVIVKNNIIRDDVVVTNVAFYNNIFLRPQFITYSFTNCIAEKNIFELPYNVNDSRINVISPVYNQLGVNVSLLFVGYPTQGNYSYDSRWQLQANSPAKAYGINGEDCGIFGGDSPYKLSGIADRPLIYSLDVPFSVGGNNVNINIKIRAEN